MSFDMEWLRWKEVNNFIFTILKERTFSCIEIVIKSKNTYDNNT